MSHLKSKPLYKVISNYDQGLNINSVGYAIDLLIRSNLKNWEGKELFFNTDTVLVEANKAMFNSFQANIIRNKMITKVNTMLHNGPEFHFRNYHNY